MDFWSRLIGGSGRPGRQTPPKKISPQQRLDRFRKALRLVQSLCSQPQRLSRPGSQIEQLLLGLRQLASLIREELRSPAPYPCLALVSTSQIYNGIARAASVCEDERIIREAVSIFSILIDSEVEGFASSMSFARAFIRFSMKVLDTYHVLVNVEIESSLVEVLFNIAAKIRLEPDVLSAWFAPSHRAGDTDVDRLAGKNSFVGTMKKDDFPLCYLFMDRVHSEGRIGDFARTGLLYIFEAAARAPSLEAWIIASDLPTLMASALGALYSQLSRELSLRQDDNSLPLLLAMSDYIEQDQETGVETISSQSHKTHMATFLSDLTFWQDILDHCRSEHVKRTLLDHFQVLFLQQLLYPSLLQSSDTDGGSSVAVMTYLNSILQTLTDDGLSNMLLTYLLGSQPGIGFKGGSSQSPDNVKGRYSLMHISKAASDDDRLEPSLFNLVDLIHNGIQSRNSQTVFASLKLFTTILTLQPPHALGGLVRLDIQHRARPGRTIGALHRETSALMHLAASIGGLDGMEEAFEGASYDFKKNIEMRAFHRVQAGRRIESRNNSVVSARDGVGILQAPVDLNDIGIRSILAILQTFLCNAVDTNLALTEAILALTTSMDVDISGLLAIHTNTESLSASNPMRSINPAWMDQDEADAVEQAGNACLTPDSSVQNKPAILGALGIVKEQVASLRQSLARFDAILAKRKAILQTPQKSDLFSTPAKTAKSQRTSALSLSRHASPSPTPRPGSRGHARQISITTLESRNESPSGASTGTPRGRHGSGMPTLPINSTASSPFVLDQTLPASPRRPQSNMGSPVRSLAANIFRPPPPEPETIRSPPLMGSINASTLSPARPSTSRTGSVAPTLGRSPSPTKAHLPALTDETLLSPNTGSETDAQLLNLRITFDRRGSLTNIGELSGTANQTRANSALASGVQTPRSGRAEPLNLAERLRSRGEVVPPSTRDSSVGGGYSSNSTLSEAQQADDTVKPGGGGGSIGGGSQLRHELEDPEISNNRCASPFAAAEGDVSNERYGKDGQASSAADVDEDETGAPEHGKREVSLSHVLTNIVVLQNFTLELVAVMQHRALVYEGEVRFR